MTERTKIATAILVTLVAAGSACADMMPILRIPAVGHPSAQVADEPAQQSTHLGLYDIPTVADLHACTFDLQQAIAQAAAPAPLTPPAQQLLAPGHSSFDLCLYALMGLGLCKSAPWMKKMTVGAVPDWHCAGGVGPAVGPGCLCPIAGRLGQPDGCIDGSASQRRTGAIISSWRESQFTPNVMASRGPPVI